MDNRVFEDTQTRFPSAQESKVRSETGSGKYRTITLKYRTAVGLVLSTAIAMFWIFVLGIFVGRGVLFENPAGQKLEDLLGKPMNGKNPPAVEMADEVQDQVGNPEGITSKLTFYRDLKKNTPEPERGLPAPKPPQAPPLPQVRARENPSATSATKKKPASNRETRADPRPAKVEVASGVKTVSDKKSEAPAPKRRPGDNFTVQVSAAASTDEAERAVQRLKSQGYDAYYYQVELNGRTYFRVRVGRYASRDQAQSTLDRLAADGRKNLFISILTD